MIPTWEYVCGITPKLSTQWIHVFREQPHVIHTGEHPFENRTSLIFSTDEHQRVHQPEGADGKRMPWKPKIILITITENVSFAQ